MDYKREFKELYLPPRNPVLVTVPSMHFIMLDGTGDPNGNQAFQQAVELLYGLSFTIKMSKMKNKQPEGYFDYVVPPLEGLWWIDGGKFSFEERDNWRWTLMIRQPEFVTREVFAWAVQELAARKPDLPVDKAKFEGFDEGLCVQAMHIGPYSTEPETIAKIDDFIRSHGLKCRLGSDGKHHEIYLSDPRKSKPEKLKTVLRHPVEKA